MKEFFDIIGWKNLAVVFLTLIIIRISITLPFLSQWLITQDISWAYFLMYAFGVAFMFAGNNIILKYTDEKEKIIAQNPAKSFDINGYPDVKRLKNMFIVFYFTGLLALVYSGVVNKTLTVSIITAIIIFVLGYAYAVNLRHRFLAGNITLSVLNSAIIFLQRPFNTTDLIPYNYYEPITGLKGMMNLDILLLFLCGFAFLITMIWDITGDVTNTPQDRQKNFQTIGVKLGEKRSKAVLYCLTVLLIVLTGLFSYKYFTVSDSAPIITVILIVILPMFYYMYMLHKADKPTDYNFLYTFSGMIFISLLFIISFCKNIFIHGTL